MGQGGHVNSTDRVGRGCSGSGSSGIPHFCYDIRSEMFSGSWRIKLADWGGQRSNIVLVSLEEFPDILDFFISGIQYICVRCMNVDEVIGSSVLNILI